MRGQRAALTPPRFIGILPAAGIGSRLHPSRYPKELIPVAFAETPDKAGLRPVLAIEYSLRAMQRAGVSNCFVVIADWKTEVVRCLGDGGAWGLSLAYLHRAEAHGLADAIDAADAWIDDAYVCLTLPDTVFAPDTALASLRDDLLRRKADLCLAVFPTSMPQQLGPVRFEADGRIVEVLEKPSAADVSNTWGAAVWSPRVSRLLHQRVTAHAAPGELVLADVFNQAIREGMSAYALPFADGSFTDVGRPGGLQSLLMPGDPLRP